MARAKALPGFHAVTGSDTTDRLRGVGKKTAHAKLLEAPDAVVKALIDPSKGNYHYQMSLVVLSSWSVCC